MHCSACQRSSYLDTVFTIFEENLHQTSSVRQVVPPDKKNIPGLPELVALQLLGVEDIVLLEDRPGLVQEGVSRHLFLF